MEPARNNHARFSGTLEIPRFSMLIDMNPSFQIGRRKASRADKLTSSERLQKVRPLTWEQRDALLAEVKDDRRHAALFQLLAKAGLRPGEAFALKPGDIDWKGRTLRVERAWNLGRVKPTKTYEERTVDLTPEMVRSLERHVAWLKTEALRWAGASPSGCSRTTRGCRWMSRACAGSSRPGSRTRSSPPSASTTSATPSRRCSWPRAPRSPT